MYSPSQVNLFLRDEVAWYKRYVLKEDLPAGDAQKYFDMGNVFDRRVKAEIMDRYPDKAICSDMSLEVEPSGEGLAVGEARWSFYLDNGGFSNLCRDYLDPADRIILEPYPKLMVYGGAGGPFEICGKPDMVIVLRDRVLLYDWKCVWSEQTGTSLPKHWEIASDFYLLLVPTAQKCIFERIGPRSRHFLGAVRKGDLHEQRVVEYVEQLRSHEPRLSFEY